MTNHARPHKKQMPMPKPQATNRKVHTNSQGTRAGRSPHPDFENWDSTYLPRNVRTQPNTKPDRKNTTPTPTCGVETSLNQNARTDPRAQFNIDFHRLKIAYQPRSTRAQPRMHSRLRKLGAIQCNTRHETPRAAIHLDHHTTKPLKREN